ncbi:type II secretion system F family protein [Mesobacillus maritimus]|uniref:competence type IV pilus assembly protein ComGB n=1 Tax=Mesobacillus maritimus TaxID=1643336 RepID=UPI00203CF249|nr:competence type IV pilus assembly protein ComGB [Mesobacillus maritimus]MCM3586349.1 type II secretion system F family protein [Mesobacillus maritimus]
MSRVTKWSVQEQAQFLRRVGELLSRGYPIAEAIDSLSFYLESRRQVEIRRCLGNLKEGYPFYQVLAELKFNKELISYVYFAEQHGGLANAFIEASRLISKRDADYRKLRNLLSYPLFLFILTSLLFYFVQESLLPRFSTLYQNMNVEATIFSEILTVVGSSIPLLFYFSLLLVAIGMIYFHFVFKKFPILVQRARLVRTPLLGKLLRLFYSHFFSSQLSYLLTSGMSVMEALQVFENNNHERFSLEIGKGLKEQLATGVELDCAIRMYSFFEEELARIVRHGQENGKVDLELSIYSHYCLSQLEVKMERGMKIVQPLLFSVIGILIVSLYLAIMLPMFQLIQGI